MTITPHALLPALLVPLFLLSLYRRLRRNFGRQQVKPKRMTVRVVILIAIAVITLSATHQHDPRLIAGGLAGLAIGAALATLGLRLTRFESTPQGEFYTPNGYIGAALTAIFVSRLLYRFTVLAPVLTQGADSAAGGGPFGNFQRSPLTLGIFTVLIGYYAVYNTCILLAVRRRASAATAGADS
ncbi:MAG TPA: hypothetical protein VJQ47_17695 [Steroidobacteraceae bacterium]|nr:hypothetical protein [Steroidobacteraceae bacterium]